MGFWKLFDRLRVEGRAWNDKHVHRLLRAAGEFAATDHPAGAATDSPTAHGATGADQTWALDFMAEALYDGRRVRLLTIIDEGVKIAMGLSSRIVVTQRTVS